ncbi:MULTISPECIES: glycosyltransferase family A protein [unclassified Crossiella]|uniref:glycosyltransferase family 2 protein n=1 Tax=unclassified Crossiella TaxID=2620835 RepID=UPI001FFF2254|nr:MULTISPECIES: glycosyltransferase family A protein [unclassified Crossiella]MCK2244626.1 glycosyltransferase family 2 protein [Crossiella sp. S99.2]MCK2258387.1 glycosyltransferase family 2 protein [Crossiella sp. S99.1]
MVTEQDIRRGLADTSVIIPLGADPRIAACIDSIDEEVEIVLALHHPSEQLKEWIRNHPRPLTVTEVDDPGNLGAACNAGAEVASGRYHLLMDRGGTFAPGAVRLLVTAALTHPVVTGWVVYGEASNTLGKLVARVREYDVGDYINALSPPLICHRDIVPHIGGYLYDPLLRRRAGREFDFRLQLAGIPVHRVPAARVCREARAGLPALRGYYRQGIGEGIAQETGVVSTPAIPLLWRGYEAARTLVDCARIKGPGAAAWYALCQLAFHAGTLAHLISDPYGAREHYPRTAARVRVLSAIPSRYTTLTESQREALRRSHRRQGRVIDPVGDLSVFTRAAGTPA